MDHAKLRQYYLYEMLGLAAILARLVATGMQVPGVVRAGRNRIGLSETARPAIVVLDADEAAEEEGRASRPAHRRNSSSSRRSSACLSDKGGPAIGAELNAFRRRMVCRELTDGPLLGSAGRTCFVRYARLRDAGSDQTGTKATPGS